MRSNESKVESTRVRIEVRYVFIREKGIKTYKEALKIVEISRYNLFDPHHLPLL